MCVFAVPTFAQHSGRDSGLDEVPWQDLQQEVLPPLPPWNGSSRTLALRAGDAWVTPAERTSLRATPRYRETIAWLDSLCRATPLAHMQRIGRSNEGRDIWMVVVSADSVFSSDELRAIGKPTLLAQAGIHAGEIDGKDAGMMLLRDLTVRGTLRPLLDDANFLFVPILNVDGHERFTAFGRMNQRGPEQMGWRSNANNLNLNRDYAKLDTPGVRAIVQVLNEYDIDLYVDLHVTDGADYQYDITWGGNGPGARSRGIERWFAEVLDPQLHEDLVQFGHIPGPLIFAVDGRNLDAGLVHWTSEPRYSNGYGDARSLPTVLVENHSLKPYEQRVLGTRVLLESMLRTLGREATSLRRAVSADRDKRSDPIVLDFVIGDGPHGTFDLMGVQAERVLSPVSGDVILRYNGKPERRTVPYLPRSAPLYEVERPRAYWIPATWQDVIQRLRLHGIRLETMDRPMRAKVELYRLAEPQLESMPFEGRVRMTATLQVEQRTQTFAAGSVRVPMDQPLGTLAALLLEPEAPDSFLRWGFFHAVLQRTEYAEPYVLDALAERLLADHPDLRREFEQRLLSDAAFAADAAARRQWFESRTPWYDTRWNLYPVVRELR